MLINLCLICLLRRYALFLTVQGEDRCLIPYRPVVRFGSVCLVVWAYEFVDAFVCVFVDEFL